MESSEPRHQSLFSTSSSSTTTTTPSPRKRSPSPPPTLRSRLNSKDIPRTYSGLYGHGGELNHQTPSSDLLPFELSRNRNTDWLLLNNKNSLRPLLVAYMFIILFIYIVTLPFVPFQYTFTCTNLLHGAITLVFLHWIKGSPNWYEQGELNAMTLWEQLSSSPDNTDIIEPSIGSSSSTKSSKRHRRKRGINNQLTFSTGPQRTVLLVAPTILCYLSCYFIDFDGLWSMINLLMWICCMVPKMDNMVGVRVMGINRTIGIDDDLRRSD